MGLLYLYPTFRQVIQEVQRLFSEMQHGMNYRASFLQAPHKAGRNGRQAYYEAKLKVMYIIL